MLLEKERPFVICFCKLSVCLFVYFLRLSKDVLPGCFQAWTDSKLPFFFSLPSVRIVMIRVVSHQTSTEENV